MQDLVDQLFNKLTRVSIDWTNSLGLHIGYAQQVDDSRHLPHFCEGGLILVRLETATAFIDIDGWLSRWEAKVVVSAYGALVST